MYVGDLRIYPQPIGGEVIYFRDKNNREVDLLVSLRDGRWGGIEVEAISSRIDEGAASLPPLRDSVDTGRMILPSFLAVVMASRFV